MSRISRTIWAGIAGFGLTLLVVMTPGGVSAQAWPTRQIEMIVGFPAGGSADVVARIMAPYFAESLGVPVIVINKPGANGQIAVTYLLAQKPEGYTFLFSSLSPFIPATIVKQNAPYSIDDLSYVNVQWTDWDLLFIRKESNYRTLLDLIKDIKARPGSVSLGVVVGSPSYYASLMLLDANGIRREDVIVVDFKGGNEVRLAVLGGHVSFTVVPGQETSSLRDRIRPLAVFQERRRPDWDAPTIAEALAPLGTKVQLFKGTMRGLATASEFKSKYPDRYEKLTNAYRDILARQDVQQALQKSGIGGEWLGPEKTTSEVKATFELVQKLEKAMESK